MLSSEASFRQMPDSLCFNKGRWVSQACLLSVRTKPCCWTWLTFSNPRCDVQFIVKGAHLLSCLILAKHLLFPSGGEVGCSSSDAPEVQDSSARALERNAVRQHDRCQIIVRPFHCVDFTALLEKKIPSTRLYKFGRTATWTVLVLLLCNIQVISLDLYTACIPKW